VIHQSPEQLKENKQCCSLIKHYFALVVAIIDRSRHRDYASVKLHFRDCNTSAGYATSDTHPGPPTPVTPLPFAHSTHTQTLDSILNLNLPTKAQPDRRAEPAFIEQDSASSPAQARQGGRTCTSKPEAARQCQSPVRKPARLEAGAAASRRQPRPPAPPPPALRGGRRGALRRSA
jgi:hypothetical protein